MWLCVWGGDSTPAAVFRVCVRERERVCVCERENNSEFVCVCVGGGVKARP